MTDFAQAMQEYQRQLAHGAIQIAYRGLMAYMLRLRAHFQKTDPHSFVSSLYFGYMDMTYFSWVPAFYKERKLKPAIVFVHESFRFEIWLAAANKQMQAQTWRWIQSQPVHPYRLVENLEGEDAILVHILAEQPDFSDLDGLTARILRGSSAFVQEVASFLAPQLDKPLA